MHPLHGQSEDFFIIFLSLKGQMNGDPCKVIHKTPDEDMIRSSFTVQST